MQEKLFDNIHGCESGKRALAICVAGRHNLLIVGPPGTGKTLLAKSILDITPPLSKEESFECTALKSLYENNAKIEIVNRAPFRSPHHTSSCAAIIGDLNLNPGEITKSHNGFLFLDEIVEFESRVIDSLREPMESGILTLSKIKGTVTMPANFTLIATMNPCKCGFADSKNRRCQCRPTDVIRYRNKISGPILDRFDLVIHVDMEEESNKNTYLADKNHKTVKNPENSASETRETIEKAIEFAKKRHNRHIRNGKLPINQFNPYKTDNSDGNQNTLVLPKNLNLKFQQITKEMKISRRGFVKILKIARTIADLELQDEIGEEHLFEALSYKQTNI